MKICSIPRYYSILIITHINYSTLIIAPDELFIITYHPLPEHYLRVRLLGLVSEGFRWNRQFIATGTCSGCYNETSSHLTSLPLLVGSMSGVVRMVWIGENCILSGWVGLLDIFNLITCPPPSRAHAWGMLRNARGLPWFPVKKKRRFVAIPVISSQFRSGR